MIIEKIHILLVEDEVLIAMMEKRKLTEAGYIVTLAHDSQSAIQLATESMNKFDVILMDIDLGTTVDGTETARTILKKKDIPIVFLSSHTEPEIVEKTETITSYGYVVKNSSIVILDVCIKMALKLFREKIYRLETEKELRESRATWQKLFDESADAILLIDKNRVFVECNQAALELLKMSKEEFLLKPPVMISPEYQPNGIRSDEAAQEMMDLAYEKGLHRFEWTCLNTEGGEFMLEVSLMPISINGEIMLHTTWRDITERKILEKTLQEKEILARTMIENLPIILYLLDNDGIFRLSTGAGLSSLGLKPNQVVGLSALELYKEYPQIISSLKAALTGKQGNFESFVNNAYHFNVVTPYIVGDKQAGIAGVALDITDRKAIEEELRHQLLEKETILKEVHHRIKNNMGNIESLISLQLDTVEHPQAKIALQESLTRVQAMRVLYEKLLSAGDYSTVCAKTYLEDLIDSIITVFRANNKIQIEKQIEQFDIDARIAVSVGIIINELLTNVFKYAFTNSDSGKVVISMNKSGSHINLTISDNGSGFKAKQTSGATGLGLTIVQLLTEQLKGTYALSYDEGTKINIEFDVRSNA